LGDLIFAPIALKKASNSQPLASFFQGDRREKQKTKNSILTQGKRF
jgi:hypothetical protein